MQALIWRIFDSLLTVQASGSRMPVFLTVLEQVKSEELRSEVDEDI